MRNDNRIDKIDWVIIVLSLISIAIGVIGWIGFYKLSGAFIGLDNAIYKSLQLFVFNADFANKPVPILLNIARFTSPILLATAVIKLLVYATSKQMNEFMVKHFYKNHYVICGLGMVGYKIALDCLKNNVKLVIIEIFPDKIFIPELVRKGAIVIIGDATSPINLKRANIQKAKVVFAVTEIDTVNMQISFLVEGLFRKQKKQGELKCLIHIEDTSTLNLLLNQSTIKHLEKDVRKSLSNYYLKPFNINQIASSLVLEKYPPDSYCKEQSAENNSLNILIIGMGNIGENLLLNFARSGHYLCNISKDDSDFNKKNTVHIIDTNAHKRMEEIRALYPKIDNIINCQIFHKTALALNESDFKEMTEKNKIPIVYVCLENDAERFKVIHMLKQYVVRSPLKIVNLMPVNTSCGFLAAKNCDILGDSTETNEGIKSYNIIDNTCRKDILVNEKLDLLAKTIHNYYSSNNPDADSWDELQEVYKMSSRFQAEHLKVKLRAMGFADLKNLKPEDIYEKITTDAGLLNTLSELEHIRYVAERFLDGWDLATEAHDNMTKAEKTCLKVNTTLKSYKSIDDNSKAYCRESIEKIPELIKVLQEE